MHLKTIRHQKNSIKRLLNYMINGMQDKENDLMMTHNLPSLEVNKMVSAFLNNDTYRRTPALTRWYDEVLSFSPLDKEHITAETLSKIAKQYIQMRNPRALCFAVSHRDTDHQHLHFCFSGVEFRNRKTLRMDDEVFKNLREGIEYYQQQEFPELKNSIVYLGKEKTKERAVTRDRNARKEREFQAKKRIGKKTTAKAALQTKVREAYNTSKTTSKFYKSLKAEGLAVYERNGKTIGVIGKRKYRFSTLGVTSEMLLSLQRLEKREREFDSLTNTGKENMERER